MPVFLVLLVAMAWTTRFIRMQGWLETTITVIILGIAILLLLDAGFGYVLGELFPTHSTGPAAWLVSAGIAMLLSRAKETIAVIVEILTAQP